VDLPPEEAHHARTVLRLRVGDEAVVIDGQGTEARGRVDTVSRDGVSLILEGHVRVPYEHDLRLTLAVAMPRAPRQPFLFEKCGEIGVEAIWPVEFERSVVRPGPGVQAKGQRVVIEAAKQARRAWVPRVEEPRSFADAIHAGGSFDKAVVLAPSAAARPLARVLEGCRVGDRMLAWIGPEGGLTEEETASACGAGAVSACLGPTVLRIETAALVTAALVAGLGAGNARGPSLESSRESTGTT
jgi:16S rRNA (uracil1498-N3)-methyltransferase